MIPVNPNDEEKDTAEKKLAMDQQIQSAGNLEIEEKKKDEKEAAESITEKPANLAGTEETEESSDDDEDDGDEDGDDEDEEEEQEQEEEDQGDPNELVTLESYRYAYEAELAKLHLEIAGITSFIIDAEAITMDWFLGNALGYIKLQVARSQVPAALEVLDKAHPDPNAPRDEDPESEEFRCLSCGSSIPDEQASCPSCGWSYDPSQDTRIMDENGPEKPNSHD